MSVSVTDVDAVSEPPMVHSGVCKKHAVKRCASSHAGFSGRKVALLATTSLLSMLLFILDASLPKGLRASCDQWECPVYFISIAASAAYVGYVSQTASAPDRAAEVASMIKNKLDSALAAARGAMSQAAESAAWLAKEVRPPSRSRTARRDREGPVVPVLAVYILFASLTFICAASVALAFLANDGDGLLAAPNSFLDASPRVCGPDGKPLKATGGLSWRSATWLGVALGLSSGLCAIHPLQSGLVLGA